jgi:glycogen synthase
MQPSSDESIRFNSSRSKTSKLGGMGDIAVENIHFIHRRGDSMRMLRASFRQMRPSGRSAPKGKVKGSVRKQWRNECDIRYRSRDGEGFEMYIIRSLNLGC